MVYVKNGSRIRILRKIPHIYGGTTFYDFDQDNGRKDQNFTDSRSHTYSRLGLGADIRQALNTVSIGPSAGI